MNFRKTEYRAKRNKKKFKDLKYSTQQKYKYPKKLIANLSCNNFFHKPGKQPLFLKTANQNDLDKLLFKNSSSKLFRGNDVDLVHNLNFDYMGHLNDNNILRENLISNSLQNKTKEKEEEEKMFDIFDEKITKNENKKDELELPKISKLKTLNKYKSYELIQNHKKKIQNEMSEQIEKELINKIKGIRNNMNQKKIEKSEIFIKIKKIELELDEIYMENFFSKEKYKKQIDDIVKKTLEEGKEEEIKNKLHAKLEAKKKRYFKPGNFHMEIYKQNKAETNINNSKNSSKISINTIKNNNNNINNLPSTSANTNIKNENPKNNFNKMDTLKNIDFEINNMNNPNSRKSMSKKSLENFKINILQTQRKKEFDSFQSAQKEKKLMLKLELKNLENDLNKINKVSDNLRKEEKEIINKLMIFYKELLFKGKETKKDGLVWIIKSIWYLGENVPVSFMPEYLDLESIEYLFQLAHKQLEIDYFMKKIREMKLALKKEISLKYKKDFIKLNQENETENENNNYRVINKSEIYRNMKKIESNETENENKKNIYKDLVKEFEEKNMQLEITKLPEVSRINNVKKHIEKIKKEIIELKKNEVKRISKCFIENNYEDKYHTNIETVLTALIGKDAKDTAMNKFNLDKKNYLSKLKKIRFFDHEHIRKILSKY